MAGQPTGRSVFAACVLALAVAMPDVGGRAATAANAVETPAEDELLVLQLRLDKVKLTADLTAFADGGRLFLPLGRLAQLLEIGPAARDRHCCRPGARPRRRASA